MKKEKKHLIGIDARFFGAAGPGRYTKAIVEHLEKVDKKNKYVVFLRKKYFDLYNPKNSNFKKVLAEHQWYSFDEQIRFLFKVLRYNLDLFYVPHFNIPVLYPKKIITAIPDITMHKYSTDSGTTLFKPYFAVKKFIYRLVVPWALIRAKKNIVPTEDVKNDLSRAFPFISKDKYVVAYEGVDPDLLMSDLSPDYVVRKLNIKRPFLLYVSSMSDHKNVKRLIEAFKLLIDKYKYKGYLVLVGKKDLFSKKIEDKVIEMKLEDKVFMPGMRDFITDKEIVALRKAASVYVFPSLKEGFSLTPLEAQALELPCIISDIPCHKEVYGDSVYYFNPKSVNDMARKIHEVIKSKKIRDDLIKKGSENVKKYDWSKTAEVTLKVFNDCLNGEI